MIFSRAATTGLTASRATRFFSLYSRSVLCLWGGLAVSIFIFNTLHFRLYLTSLTAATERFLLPLLFAAAFLFCLRLNAAARLAIANCLVAATIALYAGEFYLAARLEWAQRDAAKASGLAFDPRTKLEVIRDLRRKGVDAFPVMRAENMLRPGRNGMLEPILSSHGVGLLPMASIPGTTVVSCNESGQWQVYVADRHGFNNPDGAWDNPRPQIGMVGDSFTHGSCVPRDSNMAAHLRHRFGSVINLGVGGFGPLLELASLTEYLTPLKPPTVLWVFFEGNDLTDDLPFERQSPLLQTYLKRADFSQHLIDRPREIAGAMRRDMEPDLKSAMERVDGPYENLVRYASLDRMREQIGLGPVQIGYNPGHLDDELKLFRHIIVEARNRVAAWHGKFYLVYLPASERYLSKVGSSLVRQTIYKGVRDIAAREKIPVIDIAKAFSRVGSPMSLYVYPGSHFNAAGYRVASDVIATALNATPGLVRR